MALYQKLRAVVFLDGRPGHEKQSMGLIAGLGKYTDLEFETVKVVKRGPIKSFLLALSLRLGFPQRGGTQYRDVDLFLGTGRHTHIPLLTAKRGAPNGRAVCCMTPSSLLRPLFDLCLTPSHDGKKGKNIISTLGAPNSLYDHGKHNANFGLILVGGISTAQEWSTKNILASIKRVVESNPQKQWAISSSPRTPQDTLDALHVFAHGKEQVEFFRYQDTPPGWVETQYYLCQDVWVSADSISMVFEALTAGCSVGLLPVHWKKKKGKFQDNERLLITEGYVKSLADIHGALQDRRCARKLNESERVAEIMLERWWQAKDESSRSKGWSR